MVQQFFAFHLATISWVQNSSMNPKRREDISTSSCSHNNVLWCNRSNSMAYWGFVMYLLVSLVPPFRFGPDLLHVSCVLPGPASALGLCSPGHTVQGNTRCFFRFSLGTSYQNLMPTQNRWGKLSEEEVQSHTANSQDSGRREILETMTPSATGAMQVLLAASDSLTQ